MGQGKDNSRLNAEGELPAWLRRARQKQARRKAMEQVGVLTGYLITLVLIVLQLTVGALRRWSAAGTMVNVVIVVFVGSLIALMVIPERTMRVLQAVMRVSGESISKLLFSLVIGGVYILTLPVAATAGRREYLKRHPSSRVWVTRDGSFKSCSTWSAKSTPTGHIPRRTGTLRRTLVFFLSRGNWFLFVVALLLLILGSFMALASSPVLTPFIYPLF